MTSRSLIVMLDLESRQILSRGLYQLNIFKGSISDEHPIIGTLGKSLEDELGLKNTITWQDAYAGYTSPISSNKNGDVTIKSSTALDMELGDQYFINSDGDAVIKNGEGVENKLVIRNGDSYRGAGYCFAFGSKKAQDQEPVCVVEAVGNSTVTIRPKNKYLVTFSSAGTVSKDVAILEINSASCTADYSDDTTERVVWYNAKTGRWAETEEEAKVPVDVHLEAVLTNGWFNFIKQGASALNTVLNG